MTPIEKAARAIYCDGSYPPGKLGANDDKWAKTSEVQRAFCRQQAWAVLPAIREPSEAMVEAMRVASGHQISRTDLKLAYVAAIDAALKEGP